MAVDWNINVFVIDPNGLLPVKPVVNTLTVYVHIKVADGVRNSVKPGWHAVDLGCLNQRLRDALADYVFTSKERLGFAAVAPYNAIGVDEGLPVAIPTREAVIAALEAVIAKKGPV